MEAKQHALINKSQKKFLKIKICIETNENEKKGQSKTYGIQ